jgi:dihydropteroate synthase
MHMRGEPATMQQDPVYDDVVGEVRSYLVERATEARDGGVDEVWVDPGIGFGKTVAHNLALLRHLRHLVAAGFPVVVGTSRKSFLGRLTGGPDAPDPVDDRLEASLATAAWAMRQGAAMVRAHDVRPTVQLAALAGNPLSMRSGTQPPLRSGTQPPLRSGTQPPLRSGTQP